MIFFNRIPLPSLQPFNHDNTDNTKVGKTLVDWNGSYLMTQGKTYLRF